MNTFVIDANGVCTERYLLVLSPGFYFIVDVS
jgi:hypothetical protein